MPIDGILVLDKPAGVSSNHALQQARRIFNASKAGHGGTLDPFATGILPVLFGEATKFAAQGLLDADKSYLATVRLGQRTSTGDCEGEMVETRSVCVSDDALEAVLARFRGAITQVPPMHSALKIGGIPLYRIARRGETVARSERKVRVSALILQARPAQDVLELQVSCSKGTYVRVLAEDIGAALGCGAHLQALRRTQVGALALRQAHTLEALAHMTAVAREAALLPIDALLHGLVRADLDAPTAQAFCHGRAVPAQPPAGTRRVYRADRFLGLGEVDDEGLLAPLRLVAGSADAQA